MQETQDTFILTLCSLWGVSLCVNCTGRWMVSTGTSFTCIAMESFYCCLEEGLSSSVCVLTLGKLILASNKYINKPPTPLILCVDKSSVVQRFSFLPLLWGNPLSKLELEAGKDSQINELGVKLFILCLSKLPLNMKCFPLSRELAVELTPTQPSVGQVRGNVAPSWALWCVGVTWAGQSHAVTPVPLLGQAGRGTECLSVDFLSPISVFAA